MRKWASVIIGLSLGGLFGWLAFRRLDWSTAWGAMTGADWRLLTCVPPLMLSSVFFRALRWRLILADAPQARVGALALAAGIGVGANSVLPAKLGEAVGAHALGRLADLSRIQSLGIVVITRVVDLLVLFALVLAAAFALPSPETRAYVGFSIAIVGITGTVLLVPLLCRYGWARGMLERGRAVAERVAGQAVVDFATKFARGIGSAGHLPQLLAFLGSTALLWGMFSLSLLVVLHAFRIPVSAPLVPLILGLIAVSAIVPSAPGNVGTFHWFGIQALLLVGVDRGLAAGCIVTYHAMDMVSALALGAVCWVMAHGRLSLRRASSPEIVKIASAAAEGLAFPEAPPEAVGVAEFQAGHSQAAGAALTVEKT